MVLDTSALLAVLFNEEEAQQLRLAIEADPVRLLSAASLVEAGIVVHARLGDPGDRELDRLVQAAGLEVTAVDAAQAEMARDAYRRFGRGRHAAALNYGDCFSYALAKASGERLLHKGTDFGLTDIELVDVTHGTDPTE